MLKLGYVAASLLIVSGQAWGFCGFYVAQADTKLFNKASQVVLVRDGDKTVLTMANDFKGDLKEFAIVIPVPTFIEKEQIHIGNKAHIDHLDAYTAPRLVEYFDENPCPMPEEKTIMYEAAPAAIPDSIEGRRDGVKIEAQYTIGEYDILILSAQQSNGLVNWLKRNSYQLPKGAESVLGSYLKQKMHFFVAKVNLAEQAKLGYNYLRPLQVAYESPKFMLPIRLGTLNADGAQELFIYILTRQGRVETTNYRTVKLPTDVDLPVYIKDDFANFYRALFDHQVEKENMRTVFLEYAWNLNIWCDPCAATPPAEQELRELGVFWTQPESGSLADTFVTRLHLRYNAKNFPEDLIFQETSDRTNFQGRYVLRHAWQGTEDCPEAQEYRRNLTIRWEKEAQELADLTGWDIQSIRQKMNIPKLESSNSHEKWWQKLWK